MACEINNILEEIFVIKDLVPSSFQDSVINHMSGENSFPWYTIDRIGHKDYFNKDNVNVYIDNKVSDYGGLYHLIFDEGILRSNDFHFFIGILESYCSVMKKTISSIHRIRIRYTHPIPGHTEEKYAAPHIDFNSETDFTTLVYYVNDSDGDTILFSKKHIAGEDYDPIIKEPLFEVYRHTPKKGEAIIFNGHRYHAGNYPIQTSKRIVINFDFIEHEA